MQALSQHDDGVFYLGKDGVVRSFHPNGSVIDTCKLNPNQIQQLIKGHGGNGNLTKLFGMYILVFPPLLHNPLGCYPYYGSNPKPDSPRRCRFSL